jgi:hypothetical protein
VNIIATPRMLGTFLCTAILLAIACERGSPDAPALPASDVSDAAAEDAMPRRASCVNPVHRYSVEYPADWQANTNGIVSPCSLFDPASVSVPPASELPLEIAIRIAFEPVALSTIAGDVMGRRVLASDTTSLAGRTAIRLTAETTGEGLHDRGIGFYEYLIGLGDTTVVATTYGVGTPEFERKWRVLDAMMSSFRLFDRQ